MKATVILILALGLFVLLFFVFRQRSRAIEPNEDPAQRFASVSPDWINVRVGSPSKVQKAVESYGQLNGDQESREFVIVMSTIQDGTVALMFPNKIPPYSFLNLVGWLHAPPDVEGVTRATGWYSSPSSGVRYSLWPDDSNPYGDTLIGLSSAGDTVSVYQPDISFCRTNRQVKKRPEPALDLTNEISRIRFLVPVEVMEDFGNPTLEYTHPPDTAWN